MMDIIAVFLICLQLCAKSFTAAIEGSCLPAHISQCSCYNKVLTCQVIEDMDELKKAVELSNEFRPVHFRLVKSSLPALPEGLLVDSSFTNLRIQNSTLYFLYPPLWKGSPFIGGEPIVDFTLDEVSYPYNWNWTLLNSLTRLNTLRIINCNLLHIDQSFGTMNMNSLQTLVIENSGVKWIHAGAFASFHSLAFFHLIKNRVEIFHRSYFPTPANSLNLINLKNNKLTYIPEDLFFAMPELIYVNLENNNFATLSENVVSQSQWKRLFVDIAGNPLQCDCSLSWLQKRTDNFDVYRLRCNSTLYPDGVYFRNVDWKEMDCSPGF